MSGGARQIAELLSDAACIHLEIKALHRRAREMPGKTAGVAPRRTISSGQERMDVEDRIELGRGHVLAPDAVPARAASRDPPPLRDIGFAASSHRCPGIGF